MTPFPNYQTWALARECHAISVAVDETLFPAYLFQFSGEGEAFPLLFLTNLSRLAEQGK